MVLLDLSVLTSVLFLSQARRLFLAGQEYVTESKCYYVFDGHVSDYVEIVQVSRCGMLL